MLFHHPQPLRYGYEELECCDIEDEDVDAEGVEGVENGEEDGVEEVVGVVGRDEVIAESEGDGAIFF